MIKYIVFDYGGVLGSVADAWDTDFKEIVNITGLTSKQLSTILGKHWRKLKIGKGSESEFWKEVHQKSKSKIKKGTLEKIYEDNILVDRSVLNYAKKLKKNGHKLVLLSNNTKRWGKIKIDRYNLNDVFENIYISANIGIAKPSSEMFKYMLDDLKAKPNEMVYIDDQKNNITVAKSLGIKSHLFKNVSYLKSFLSSH